jgi:hypothetical protein
MFVLQLKQPALLSLLPNLSASNKTKKLHIRFFANLLMLLIGLATPLAGFAQTRTSGAASVPGEGTLDYTITATSESS